MLNLQPNKINLGLRCVSIIFSICIIPIFVSHLNDVDLEKIIFWQIKLKYLLYLLGLVWIFYILTVIISLLHIIKVNVDEKMETLTVTSLFNKRTVSISNILSYNSTFHKNRYKTFLGIRLVLKDDIIWLAGQNIRRLDELKDFLSKRGLKDIGPIKMKYPFN